MSDELFEEVEAWTGDARRHASGGSSHAFGKDDVEQIRRRGKFVAFILTSGDDIHPTPKTMSQWESAISGFRDIAAEIRQLDPGQTKSVGPWDFTRIIR